MSDPTLKTPMVGLMAPLCYASGYTLDLYCDRSDMPGRPYSTTSPDGRHAWNEFPHTFAGETFGECAKEARQKGWVIHRHTRTATCPKCSKRSARGNR